MMMLEEGIFWSHGMLQRIEGLTLAQKKQVTKDILLSMNAQDNNCPVVLDRLSFAKFSDYLANRLSWKCRQHVGMCCHNANSVG